MKRTKYTAEFHRKITVLADGGIISQANRKRYDKNNLIRLEILRIQKNNI